MFTSSLIQKAYSLTENANTMNQQRHEQNLTELLAAHKGQDFLVPLNFYLDKLANTHAVLIPYMQETQQNELLRELQVASLFLLAQWKYDLTHQKTENSKKYLKKLAKCEALIDEIGFQNYCRKENKNPALERNNRNTNKAVSYLGLVVGQMFAGEMVEMTKGSTTKKIRDAMGAVNDKRLYWVWASAFLKTTLSVLPSDFFSVDQASAIMKKPDLYTGTMSWALYYFRFGLNLSLLLKHTIAGPWMSKTEKQEPWTERFKTQWAQRKFTLLNDSIWATGNLLCFFWLCGKSTAGTWGDALTLALLVFDIALAIWDLEEQRTQNNKQIDDYEKALAALGSTEQLISDREASKKKLAQLELELIAEEDALATIKILNTISEERKKQEELSKKLIELEALKQAKEKCQRAWSYQKISLASNITYAVGLMIAFALLATPFLPAAATTLASMTVVGAVLCFGFSVINNAVKGGIELHKSRMDLKELRSMQKEKIKQFIEFNKDNKLDDNAKRLHFLEIKILSVNSASQERKINLQVMHLMRSILVESMIPPLVFLSLVFLPLGPGIAILASALALAITTWILIDAFKIKEQKVKALDEGEYQLFCNDPEKWVKNSNQTLAFFKPAKNSLSSSAMNADDEQTPLLGEDGSVRSQPSN